MIGNHAVPVIEDAYLKGIKGFDTEKATVSLENGLEFIVETENFYKENIYVQSVELNGVPYKQMMISHEQILKGGILKFIMGDQPAIPTGN